MICQRTGRDELKLVAFYGDELNLLDQIAALRVKVWRQLLPAFSTHKAWRDQYDDHAYHWAYMDTNKEVIAAARLSVHADLSNIPEAECYSCLHDRNLIGPFASLNRLVVDPNYQGRGLGSILDQERVNGAKDLGCRYVLNSTPSGERRVKHLVSMGFTVAGVGVFSELQREVKVNTPPVVLYKPLHVA